jgi:hypothetical protein
MGALIMLLPEKWGPLLASQPETGIGYQVATITLRDGTQWSQAVIEEGHVTRIRGQASIPFKGEDVIDVRVTHDKWDFSKER